MNSEITARDFAMRDEAVHDAAGHVDRHGETDAFAAAAAGGNPRVDADEPSVRIHERAAGIAGINRGVRLDEIFKAVDSVDAVTVASERADDSLGHCLSNAEWIADSQNDVADFELITVAQRDGRKSCGVNFQNGHVRLRIGADDFGREFFVALSPSATLISSAP